MLSTTTAAPAYSFPWRVATAGAIVFNLAMNYASQRFPFNGQDNAVVSAKYSTLLTPAGYAFSIWGVIFLGLLAYAGWQLLPAQRTNPLPDALARPFTLANVATGLWLVPFAYELLGLSLLVMLLILGSLVVCYDRARALAQWPGSWPVGLFLGWITVATVLNATLWLSTHWAPPSATALLAAIGLVNVVLVLAVLVTRRYGELAYPLAIVWALVAIGVARAGQVPTLASAALAAAGTLAVVAGWLVWRQQRRAPAVR